MSSPVYFNSDSATRLKKRKARFTFSEVHVLLDEVRKNRKVIVGKFNRGVPTDTKKRTWAEIAARVNEIGECQREVIEVIKKWSDLKCDTKRKVAAMRAGTVPNRGLNSRLSKDLTHTEKIVLQILEMDSGQSDFGPPGDEEEEEEMEEDMMGMQGSPNGATDAFPPPPSYAAGGLAHSGNQPAFDVQYEIPPIEDTETGFGDSDEDQREDVPPPPQTPKPVEAHKVNHSPLKRVAPPPAAPGARDSLAQSAALSLQEQHAANLLLETVSRSLELLAESVQQLAETQQEFVRESLQLQRDTVQVLRDFTGGAIALMHDKLNGRPAF